MGYILILFFTLLVFLVFREIVVWYWKINERISILNKMADSLAKIETALDFLATDTDRKNDEGEAKVGEITEIKVPDENFKEPKFQANKVKDENK